MMINISNVVRSFASGAFGGVANVILLCIIWQLMNSPAGYSHEFLYKQVTWGGIWGFAFMLPILSNNWWLRGAVWGTAAAMVALFVFKVVPVNVVTVIISLLVNAGAWGLVASWLYDNSASQAPGE